MKKLLILSLIGFTACISIFGQKHTENSKDQTLRGSGRVNPSSLGMEFELPLGSYAGRGINVPITLSYSSKVWRAEFIDVQPRVNNPDDCISINVPKYAENSASGWTTSMATPYIEYTGWDSIYSTTGFPPPVGACPEGGPPYDNAVIKRITVHLPSGETHELRVDDTPYTYPIYGSPPAKDGTYLATDGSNIKYVEDSATGSYKLLMPDGSFYNFKTTTQSYNLATIRKAEKFTDRNSNFTTYNDANNTWTDTLGRVLTAPLGLTAPSIGVNTYAMPGMTGTYKFHWKQLNGGTQENSALTDINDPNYQLKYMADRSSANPNATPRTSGFLFNSAWSAWLHDAGAPVFNPVVLAEIELPTGQKYKFTYDIYGRIERIYYPTGGEERLVYGVVPPLSLSDGENVSDQMNFGVVNRKVYQTAGQGTPYEWTYSSAYVAPQGYKVSITNPDATKTERYIYRGNDPGGMFGFENALAGMAYDERVYDNASPSHLVSQKLTTWAKKSFGGADWHPRVSQEESRIYDNLGNGISATTTFEYEGDLDLRDTPVLMKKTSQYPFVPVGSSLPSNPVRSTENTFLINDPNYAAVKNYYTAQNIVGLVTASEVKDGAGNVVSRAETVFDDVTNYPLTTPGSPTHWTGPINGYRGNPNTSRVWDSTKGSVTNSSAYIATHAQFDNYGNQVKAWDAKGNYTTTAFDSTYYAYPVQVTSPVPSDGTYGSNTAFVTTATFDTTTGLPQTTTDANGLETRIEYDTVTLRPLNTKTYYNNNQVGSTAETIYHDEPNNYWVKSRSQIDTNIWAESIAYFDGLGRAWKTEEVNSKGNIFVEKEFDGDGRVLRVSNPFRAGETKVWTTNVYDEASRVREVILQDGATVKTDFGVSVSGIVGVTKQITDQAGKKRKGFSDALGRMVRVIEDPTGQNLNTDYTFDTLGNLRETVQGVQHRYFMHDSLGRLLYAKQPEQDANSNFSATDPITGNTAWSTKFVYDDNGNITTTTDARNISVTGTYDNLNRLKVRDYSDPNTPDVSFYYDGKGLGSEPARSKGKTTKITSSVSETRYTSFDNLGRLLTHQQITDGQTYATSYSYNLSGGIVSETYPSGRTVNYDINSDGDLSRVWGQKASAITTYANSFNYNVSGAVEKMKLGNSKWETAAYNNRMQITQIGFGNGPTSTAALKLNYDYGTNTQNNGSLREQKINYAGLASEIKQTYTYDDLNRLRSATEVYNTSTQSWKETFDYDRYGNRTFDTTNNNTTTLSQSVSWKVTDPDIESSNNRIKEDQDNNSVLDYDFDEAGNLVLDAENRRFVYDAENHQTKFFGPSNQTSEPDATYYYDGDNKRVKKISQTETTVFVYNASGTLVAEYSTSLATTPKTSYLTTDHLGSPRVVTDQLGTVISRHDYTGFGKDVAETLGAVAGRSSTHGYLANDEIRQQYTGHERDEESQLEFAQARYLNANHGRFTSADPLMASANVKDPQTLNRYSYVLNSPYKFVDPLGLISSSTGACGQWCQGTDAGSDSFSSGGYSDVWDNFLPQQQTTPKQTTPKKSTPKKTGPKKQSTKPPESPPKPKVVDLRKDKKIKTEVEKIKGTPLAAGETPILTDVKVIEGETYNITNGSFITGYGDEATNFSGVVKPVAYLALDQGGNIIEGNGIGISEQVAVVSGSRPDISDQTAPTPPGGVFIDILALRSGEPTSVVKQQVSVSQVSRSGSLTGLINVGTNIITKDAKAGIVSVQLATPRRVQLK